MVPKRSKLVPKVSRNHRNTVAEGAQNMSLWPRFTARSTSVRARPKARERCAGCMVGPRHSGRRRSRRPGRRTNPSGPSLGTLPDVSGAARRPPSGFRRSPLARAGVHQARDFAFVGLITKSSPVSGACPPEVAAFRGFIFRAPALMRKSMGDHSSNCPSARRCRVRCRRPRDLHRRRSWR